MEHFTATNDTLAGIDPRPPAASAPETTFDTAFKRSAQIPAMLSRPKVLESSGLHVPRTLQLARNLFPVQSLPRFGVE